MRETLSRLIGGSEHVHKRTTDALVIDGTASFIAGMVVAGGGLADWAAGGAIVLAGGIIAFDRLPSAETVAIQWREYERIQEETADA